MLPNLQNPSSIFDLLNFRVSEFYGVSGSLVTKLCEGEFGVTREEWQFIAMLAHLGPLAPSDLAQRTTVDRSQASRTRWVGTISSARSDDRSIGAAPAGYVSS